MSNEDKIRAALAEAAIATTPGVRDVHEREAILAWRQIALDNGLDGVLLDRALDGLSAPEFKDVERVERSDLDIPHLPSRTAWALLATSLNDLRFGLFRTKAGEALINAAKALGEGRGSWLVNDLKRQGVKSDSEGREALYQVVVAFAAIYQAVTECDLRTALAFAVMEYGVTAAKLKIPLYPEMLRRRINDGGNDRRKEDNLAGLHRRVLKEAGKNGARGVEKTREMIVANTALIRGKTSP